MASSPPRLDVLIVGAGPTGLTLALDSRRHGLSVRLVEAALEPAPWSKAQIVHARTLEIFETLGVADAVREKGKQVHGFNVYESPSMKRVVHVAFGAVSSEAGAFLSIPQRDTEEALSKHLVASGGVIERGVRLTGFTQDDTQVRATLAHADDRVEETTAAWLVGCDGAHSTVRDVLGLAFEGSTYEQRIIQADVRVETGMRIDDDEMCAFLGPEGVLALFPLPGDQRYRMLLPLAEGQEIEPTLENFQELMRKGGPPGAVVSDPAWMVAFRVHCRMVTSYRVGRAFVAGDAAHIHSPAGGQGMNTGIQDAHNLAWKLALVERGKAKSALLDSYGAERIPIAVATLAATDTAMRRGMAALGLRNPIAIALRNRLLSFVGNLGLVGGRAAQGVSMLDIGYPESPIVDQDRPPLLRTRVLSSATVESPSVRDWADFGNGPGPGQRAVDVRRSRENEDSPRLHDSLRGTRHKLLLFDGAAHTADGYANLTSIAAQVRERFGDLVEAIAVVPLADKPSTFAWDGELLLDPEGTVHEAYGARSECLYLIRPDGHVGYRAQPAEASRLLAYLGRVLEPQSR